MGSNKRSRMSKEQKAANEKRVCELKAELNRDIQDEDTPGKPPMSSKQAHDDTNSTAI